MIVDHFSRDHLGRPGDDHDSNVSREDHTATNVRSPWPSRARSDWASLDIRVADAKELQFFLDEYRGYANTERPHQGIGGRTPEERSQDAPLADVIDLDTVRRRKLERREYAHGLLRGYALAEDAPPAKAA